MDVQLSVFSVASRCVPAGALGKADTFVFVALHLNTYIPSCTSLRLEQHRVRSVFHPIGRHAARQRLERSHSWREDVPGDSEC